MGEWNWYAVGAVAAAAVFGSLGSWVADQKRRRPGEGFLLGLAFGPLGVIVEALLPPGAGGPSSWHGFPDRPTAPPTVPRWQRPLRPLEDDRATPATPRPRP